MDRLFIFAVGGTGARVMRSLTMLMSTGALSNYEVVPILVDFDTHNGNLNQTLDLLHVYKNIHDKSYDGGAFMDNEGFFCSRLSSLAGLAAPYVMDMPVWHHDMPFHDFLDYYHLQGGNEYLFKMLLDSLFTTDEMYQRSYIGFKGNAKIARVVYAAQRIQDSVGFNAFIHSFDFRTDKVVVVGSTFGATGSVGMLEILKLLKNNHHYPIDDIASVLIEPYFLPTPDPAFGVIDYRSFYTKHSQDFLEFYNDSGIAEFVKTTYKIGMENFAIVDSEEGGEYQQNKAHIVELLSAMAICEYATTGQHGVFEHCIGDNSLDIRHHICISDFYRFPVGLQTFESLARGLLTAKFFMEYLHGNPKITSAYFYRNIQRHHSIPQTSIIDLEFVFSEYLVWLNELSFDNQNVYGLDIFNLKDPMDNVINGHPYIRRSLFRRDIMKEFVERMNQNYAELDRKGHVDSISPNQLLLKLFFNSSCDIFKLFNC